MNEGDDIGAQYESIAAAAGISAEQIKEFARTMQHLMAEHSGPITYTNRAARRARARAERRH